MTVKGLSVREPWGLEKQSFGKPREHGYHLSLNFTVSVDAKYHLFKLILSRILQRSVQKLAFHLLLCAAWFFPQTIAAEIPWIAIDTLEKIAIEKIGEKIDFKSLPACSNLKEDQLFCLRQIQLGLTLESNRKFSEAIQAYQVAEQFLPKEEPALAYYLTYRICYNYYDLLKFEAIINKLTSLPHKMKATLEANNKRRTADYYNLLALAYKKSGKLKEAKATYLQGIEKCDSEEIEQCNKLKFNLIKTLNDQADYSGALLQTQQLLDFYLARKDSTYLVALVTDLGDINKELRNFRAAEKFYQQALVYCKSDTVSARTSRIYEGLGILFSYENKIETSNYYLNKALNVDRQLQNKVGICYSINNLCKNLIFSGSQQKVVVGLLLESVKIAEEIGDLKAQQYAKFLQGAYFQEIGDFQAAIPLLIESLRYHEKEKMHSMTIAILHRLAQCHEKLGLLGKALEYKKLELQSKDSLYTSEKIRAIEEAQEKYESRNKDLQIANQKIQVLEKDRKLNLTINYGIFIGSVLLVLFIYTFWQYSRTNQQLLLKKEELRSKVDDLKSFLYSVSHDLRGPITRIRNQILMLELPQSQQEELPKRLKTIDQSSQQLAALLDELLNLAMLDHLEQRFMPISPLEMLEAVVEELQQPIQENNINVTIESSNPETNLEGDLVLLKQAFINIMTNAIKFSAKQQQPKISINHHCSQSEHIISIVDNGIGVAADDLNVIFDLFVKGKNAPSTIGVGAGLAIAKKIVLKHQGKITANRNPEGGLTILVQLPVNKP